MVEVPTLAAFNSIEMFGGYAFVPPIGPAGYQRMKARKPVRTKDGWLTIKKSCSFLKKRTKKLLSISVLRPAWCSSGWSVRRRFSSAWRR